MATKSAALQTSAKLSDAISKMVAKEFLNDIFFCTNSDEFYEEAWEAQNGPGHTKPGRRFVFQHPQEGMDYASQVSAYDQSGTWGSDRTGSPFGRTGAERGFDLTNSDVWNRDSMHTSAIEWTEAQGFAFYVDPDAAEWYFDTRQLTKSAASKMAQTIDQKCLRTAIFNGADATEFGRDTSTGAETSERGIDVVRLAVAKERLNALTGRSSAMPVCYLPTLTGIDLSEKAIRNYQMKRDEISRVVRNGFEGIYSGMSIVNAPTLGQFTMGDADAPADDSIKVDGASQSKDAAAVVSGASTTGYLDEGSVKLKNFAAAAKTIKKGQFIRFEGKYAVAPESYTSSEDNKHRKVALPFEKVFQVMEDATVDAAKKVTLKLNPLPIHDGPKQNISAALADDDKVILMGKPGKTHVFGAIWSKDPICLMTKAPLVGMPTPGVRKTTRKVPMTPINYTMIEQFLGTRYKIMRRADFYACHGSFRASYYVHWLLGPVLDDD